MCSSDLELAAFPLGLDRFGGDVLSKLIWGARASLLVPPPTPTSALPTFAVVVALSLTIYTTINRALGRMLWKRGF